MLKRTLSLNPIQQAELEHLRDCDKRAYMREQAAALLDQFADGSPTLLKYVGASPN